MYDKAHNSCYSETVQYIHTKLACTAMPITLVLNFFRHIPVLRLRKKTDERYHFHAPSCFKSFVSLVKYFKFIRHNVRSDFVFNETLLTTKTKYFCFSRKLFVCIFAIKLSFHTDVYDPNSKLIKSIQI